MASPYLSGEDITTILFKTKKVKSIVYINTKPPYPEEVVGRLYLVNYTPSIFPKYAGMAGNAKEHIRRYVDALTPHSHDHELRLKEFSKSLEGRAFICYTSLTPGSILS